LYNKKINVAAPTTTESKIENNTQQQDDPSTHITPRKPIIDTNYKLSQLDRDAATFVRMSYDDTKVVEICDNFLKAKHLRPNAKEKFILDEVISF